MSLTWPFAGRGEELSRIRRVLGSGGSVVLAGGAGVGKSRLAAEAAPGAARVRGSEAAKALPLGAFGALLPGEAVTDNLLGWAGQLVRKAVRGVLVVDDAHQLDAVSGALVRQLADSGQQLLVTVRSGEACPETIRSLWREGPAERIELEPLSDADAAEVLRRVLGGSVENAERLISLSRGNMLYLRELVNEAVTRGELTQQDGVWRWSGAAPLSGQLRELITTRIGALTTAEAEVLELVALGEPIELNILLAGEDPQALASAEERGLVTIADEAGTEVRLTHPLYGEVVRAGLPRLRTMNRYRRLVELHDTDGRGDQLRIALWRLEAGMSSEPGPLLAALRLAWAGYDYPLAERFGWAAVESGAGPEAAVLLAPVLGYGGKLDQAEAVLAQAWEQPCDERTRTLMISTRLNILATLGRAEEAIALVETAEMLLTEAENRQELMFWQSSIHFALGHFDKALTVVDAILADPVSVPMRAQAVGQRGWILTFIGRTVDALADVEAALDCREQWQDAVPVYVRALQGIKQIAASFAGELETAATAVELGETTTGEGTDWAVSEAENAHARGALERQRGRVRTAARLLAIPTPGVALSDMQAHRWAELATAAALAGEVETAEAALTQGAETALEVALGFGVDLARPWIAVARGEFARAGEIALDNVERMRHAGAITQAVVAGHDAVRLGCAAGVAEQLAELAMSCQGEFSRAAADHARAMVANDGSELTAVSQRFETLGYLLLAADAAAQAADVFDRAGRSASARSATARARLLADACEGVTTPALARLDAPRLTPRELEIARLAADGLPNRDIAERLVLSVRTVENNLHIAYQKLGVANRSELSALLRAGTADGRG
ncbi:helix-turn-helix transcriptional regulator [Nocardia huaxiensis]|uniref:helix-turn-helix transcriptional regulator n=1 Tax=Nocardia huaxiensis TaxID=2755382 RepID=UPI001E5A09B6|nr:LuxR family transcriptional regulator [Nocardia huaxiensis]UFS99610.1 LuxR C-terminal-related transcriptional regulator [Nocardia huaxiensis]